MLGGRGFLVLSKTRKVALAAEYWARNLEQVAELLQGFQLHTASFRSRSVEPGDCRLAPGARRCATHVVARECVAGAAGLPLTQTGCVLCH